MPLDSFALEVLRKLQVDFQGQEPCLVRQPVGGAEHLLVPGLPRLGSSLHASRVGGQIHLAPVLGQQLSAQGGRISLVPGGIAPQAYRCCQILEQVLLASGCTAHELVRLSCYVSKLNPQSSEVLSEVIDLFCHERFCHNITRSIIGCDRLQGDALVQMEGLAVASPLTPRPLGRVAPGSSEKARAPQARGGREDKALATSAAFVQEDEPESWILVNDPDDQPSLPGTPTSLRGLYGDRQSFELRGLTALEAEGIHSGLGGFTAFCRLTMKGPEDYRTIRLEPGIISCEAAEVTGKPNQSTISFTFGLAVEKSLNCYVNVGLVEWMAARKESPEPKGLRRSLAELLSVKSEEEDQVPGGWLPAQHVDEDPRQMMLGCRKGVQWFGSGRKFPLFQDNIMEGSLLRFRCDYHLNRQGEIAQVKVWFLPSALHFEYGGEQTITESDLLHEPLAQWWQPRCRDRKMRSLWVPAVTMYSLEDVVTVAWNAPSYDGSDS